MLIRAVSDCILADQTPELQFRQPEIRFSEVVTILRKNESHRTFVAWVGVKFILYESGQLLSS